MSSPDPAEINKIANEFLRLKKLVAKYPNDIKKLKKYRRFQDYCMRKMAYLVNVRVGKYKQFSNYNDLKQDGFEALLMAFETYDTKKGNFCWWADRYINTRIYRSANAHSTIRFPLRRAKETPPHKTNSMPILVDQEKNPSQQVEESQNLDFIMDIINELPEAQKQVILMRHEFDGGKNCSVTKMSSCLKISRNTCKQLLEEAEQFLKDKLTPYYSEVRG